MRLNLLNISLLLFPLALLSQNRLDINVVFDADKADAKIDQIITYQNTSGITLDTIYLNDWSNSFSTKTSPLAERFAEEYSTKFHFAKNEDRGYTSITSITDVNGNELLHERHPEHLDVVMVVLENPVAPQDSYKIKLQYNVHFPSSKFTDYGRTSLNEFHLKYWYITPAIYDGTWHYFSNKDLDDLYIPKSDIQLKLNYPENYRVYTELDLVTETQFSGSRTAVYNGEDRIDSRLFLKRSPAFQSVETDDFTIISDIVEDKIRRTDKAIITDKITRFITENLGEYPHQKLLVSRIDAKKDPIYGLNQLPDFIRPFPPHFQYELTLLKNSLGNYLNNVLHINPRKDQWLVDGIQIYFMMKYIDTFYPDMKMIGSFADVWGIRSFHAADLDFNDQYVFVYMHMARTNRDQPLLKAKDSLQKFNQNLANKYKAGLGLRYLDHYVNAEIIEETIKDLVQYYGLKPMATNDFARILETKTEKPVDWFFEDYLATRGKIDFKISELTTTNDSVRVTIKNKRDNKMPVSVFLIKNDSVVDKTWVTDIIGEKSVTLPKSGADKLVLNYDYVIPEFNLRDNWKSLEGSLFDAKPLQVRLFKDFEDPRYTQLFIMPMVEFRNIYDGLTLGTKIYNKTVLQKPFHYKFTPQYATRSNSLTGTASLVFVKDFEDQDLFRTTFVLSGAYRSYAEDLFFRRIGPGLNFAFRDKDDLRSNKMKFLNLRYLDIQRDADVNNITEDDTPNYSILNMRYIHSNDNLIDFSRWSADLQFSKSFGKLSFDFEYRKLFENNHQLNLRLFAGTFLYNDNPDGFDYFSFALDRPTDYLFDYNYLGRSEDTGIFSQQIIIAEGGFKSMLEPAFSNQWIGTANVSTTIWRYVLAYGDVGLVKNRGIDPKFVYDAGIRVNLVTDYFELYFPVYSNLGWEVSQAAYAEKIRFLFTVDPKTLLGLFRRKWY